MNPKKSIVNHLILVPTVRPVKAYVLLVKRTHIKIKKLEIEIILKLLFL